MASLRRNNTSFGHKGHRLSKDDSTPGPIKPKNRKENMGQQVTEGTFVNLEVRDFRVPAVAAPSKDTQRLDKFGGSPYHTIRSF
jgi:hypothetical protein